MCPYGRAGSTPVSGTSHLFTVNHFNMRYIVVLVALIWASCGRPIYNPSAPGFNLYDSDREAVAIADDVMEAMGGRRAWDQTRHFGWNFFGRRHLVWDKQTGDVRIDSPRDSMIYLINVHTLKGKVMRAGEEMTHSDSLQLYIERGKNMWINDSYWLVMPFKLKDSGVTLGYVREENLPSGNPADVLQLTFEQVGVTPDNKYEVWVDKSDHLIKQWAFYPKANQKEPRSVWPWDNYGTYGKILLSADRSDKKGPSDVKVFDTLPGEVYQDWKVPDWISL